MSDGFVYLLLQRRLDFDPTYLPLLFVGTATAFMLLAVPLGSLADRIGRRKVFLAGYAILVAIYASLLLPAPGLAGLVVILVALGAYYAATDGVLMALVSTTLPTELRASGLAVLVTGTSIGRLLASVTFGALWSAYGAETAVTVFAVGLGIATVGATLSFRGLEREAVAGRGVWRLRSSSAARSLSPPGTWAGRHGPTTRRRPRPNAGARGISAAAAASSSRTSTGMSGTHRSRPSRSRIRAATAGSQVSSANGSTTRPSEASA
jgi:MFS family permease